MDRTGCGSAKWDSMLGTKPDVRAGVVPLSVADMEFPTAPEIVEGLQRYIGSHVLGYTTATDAYYDAVISWQKRRHGLNIQKEWIVTTPGVVPALGYMVSAFSEPGEGVIIMPPVYYPFSFATILNERKLVKSPLVNNAGTYLIDFDDLEEKAKNPNNKLLIFCNPHNPVGRVWTEAELQRVMDICIRNDVFVIDDEIHNDLVMPGARHTPVPALSEEAALHCAYCTAPSKTFNLAGMQVSNIMIADGEKKRSLANKIFSLLSSSLNTLAYESCRLAYTCCDRWLSELLTVIDGNAKFMARFFGENLPEVRPYRLEGTYLFWADFRGLGMTHLELRKLLVNDAELFLDDGYKFGPEGRGFERFNLACPRKTVEAACARLLAAVNNAKSDWGSKGKPVHITLAAGMKMPDFTYDTTGTSGKSFLKELSGRPVAIVFHRYAGCGLTQKVIGEFAARYDELLACGGQLKVVLQSTPESVAKQFETHGPLPFEIICDPQRRLFDLFNVFPASSEIALLSTTGIRNLNKGMGGARPAAPEGEPLQLPAVIAIRGDGMVGYVHYGEDILDIPSVSELVGILKF